MKFFIIGLLSFISYQAVGQIANGDTNVVITTRYQPDVVETTKIEISPSPKDPTVNAPTFTYSFPQISYSPLSVYTPIDPIFLKPEKPELLFDNYAEIGGGNYLTSFIDAQVFNTQNKYNSYGLKFNHHAANRSNNPNQALFSKNHIKLYGLREKGNDLYAEIDYKRDVIHYYGYIDRPIEYKLSDINQIYNDISTKTQWSIKRSRYHNQANLELNLFDNVDESEQTIKLSNSYQKNVKSNTFIADFSSVYTQLTQRIDYKRFQFNFNPHYDFHFKKFQLDLGFNANYLLDSNTSQIYIAPYGKVKSDIIPEKMELYIGGLGDLKQNTLKSLARENPFLGNNLMYLNPYVWTFFTGMNGHINKKVEFGIDIKHELISDQYLFVNDTNDLRNFVTIKDNLNKTTLGGELNIDIINNTSISLLGNYYSYSLEAQKSPWQLPNYDLSVVAKTHFTNKLYLQGGYFMTGARDATNLAGETRTLDTIHDLNLRIEYRYKQNISGFIRLNNILNNRYEMWNFYRSQGINVLGGVSFSL